MLSLRRDRTSLEGVSSTRRWRCSTRWNAQYGIRLLQMYSPHRVSSHFVGGKIGHIARNCPMNEGGYSAGFGGQQSSYNDSGKTCYACGGFGIYSYLLFISFLGHMAKDCSQGQKCYNCGRLGHVSRDCDQAAQAKVCYRYLQSDLIH